MVVSLQLFLLSIASFWLPTSSFVHIGLQRSFRLYFAASLSSTDSKTQQIEFELHPSISDISAESWDACLDESSSPFLEHAWLRCLEESKCASPETGWVPQHVSIKINGEIRGYVPLYLKGHSMGEFIFDNAWAEAAYDNNINYYPKLLAGIPFTPATGQRILLHPDLNFTRQQVADLRRTVGEFLKQVALNNNISSVHLNFVTDEEATDLSGALPHEEEDSLARRTVKTMLKKLAYKDTYLRRTSLQYHWTNSNVNNDGKPYESFDDYLGCFKSKRRITIRREREKVQHDEGIRVEAIAGKDILKYEGLVERMFEIYVSTVDKLYWGRQYLTLEFFQLVCKSDFVKNLCFMVARCKSTSEELRADHVFAGTFNIVKNGVFYGRYWGCLPGRQVKNLHFETCYWSAVDYCIQNGLKRMEPGAGGGGT
jgi:predicted N-acyltransferase